MSTYEATWGPQAGGDTDATTLAKMSEHNADIREKGTDKPNRDIMSYVNDFFEMIFSGNLFTSIYEGFMSYFFPILMIAIVFAVKYLKKK
jgi:hypothetical protein